MIKLGSSSFAYTGNRDYIRGADLYELFDNLIMQAFPTSPAPCIMRRFKLAKEVERDGTWWLDHGREKDADIVRKASASLLYEDVEGQRCNAWFHEDSAIITDRIANVESVLDGVVLSGDFSGVARFKPLQQPRDYLDGLIEANKLLHSQSLKKQGMPWDQIKLVYIEDLPLPNATGRIGTSPRIEFGHIGVRTGRDRSFTLNTVSVDLGKGIMPTVGKICYSY